MIQSFKKLITTDPILNDVQQNVFDTVTEIQKTSLFTRFEFDDVSGITNNSEITLGIFKLEAGEYLIQLEAGFNVEWSVGPTNIQAYLKPYNAGTSSAVYDPFVIGVSTSLGQTWFNQSFVFKTNGSSVQLKGLINVTGGTITSRDIQSISVTAMRRFI